MNEKMKKVEVSIVPGWLLWALVVFILGYFQYGKTVDGGFAVLLIAIVHTALALVVGWIPILGIAIYFYVGMTWLLPNTLAFTGISDSWLIQLIFWSGFIFALLLTVIATLLVFKGE